MDAIACLWTTAVVFGLLGVPRLASAGVDLWVDPAGIPPVVFRTINSNDYPCAVTESCLTTGSNRRVMKFGNTIVNIGDTDLDVGFPPPGGQSDGDYHWDSCHQHHHLKQVMRYELLNSSGVVAVGRKQNFCMADSEPWASNAPPGTHTCSGPQGITRGWADIYDFDLDCQWLDITGLPDGEYTLRLIVDPLNRFAEDDETNNVTDRVVVLQEPVGVPPVPPPPPTPTLQLIGARPEIGAEAVRFTTGTEAGMATLAVYDVRGALRRTLLDRELPAGASEYVVWRGLDDSGRLLPSGIYYLRLRLPGASLSRAVLLLTQGSPAHQH